MASRSLCLSLSAVCAFALSATVHATTWYVAPEGNNGGDGSQADPFALVSVAVNAASDGDTILIGSGFYDVAGFSVNKPNLTFEGGYDTNSWTRTGAPTILRNGGAVATIAAGANNTTFRHLTLRATDPAVYNWSYGVRFQAAAGLTTIDSCIITNCANGIHNAGNNGYGIRRSGGPRGGFVTNSLFYANASGDWYDAAGRFSYTGNNKLARDPD